MGISARMFVCNVFNLKFEFDIRLAMMAIPVRAPHTYIQSLDTSVTESLVELDEESVVLFILPRVGGRYLVLFAADVNS